MANFNITDLHFFDKRGNELPLVFTSTFKITIESSYHDNAIFYGVLNPENEIEGFYNKSTGGRYKETDFIIENDKVYIKCFAEMPDNEGVIKQVYGKAEVVRQELKAASSYSDKKLYYISDLLDVDIDYQNYNTVFSSISFNTGFTFDKVSTELVETESIYVLVESKNDGQSVFTKFDEEFMSANSGAEQWANRYKLLFFIDCRNQSDFRFFNADTNEVIWNNKQILDFTKEDFRVNIGFKADEEGLYEENIIVCLLDFDNVTDNEPEIYPIGSIHMNAEAVGEDERYRTLFDNVGIPHPRNYMNVFNDADLNEELTDNIALNKNAKKIFLAYNDIFPYVGTYKALMTAVELLGYNDIFFKEWYKEIGKTVANGAYVSYDMQYKASELARTINTIKLEERIRLKKLNWISMVYKINEQIAEAGEDKYGFPYVKKLHTYDDPSLIVKLIALRDWLQKYVIGLNCRIIDIAGEGVYFERYKLDGYGTYQTLIEWNNIHNIAPYIEHKDSGNILKNGEANLDVNIGVEDYDVTIDEIAQNKFIDYCEGYIDSSSVYHRKTSELSDNEYYTYVGSTLECFNELNTYSLKASTHTDNFLFNSEMMIEDSSIKCSSLRVFNNEIFFNPYDIYLNCNRQSIFKKCPIIQLERANIRVFSKNWKNSTVYKIYPDTRKNTLSSYFIKNMLSGVEHSTIDYVTLLPPTVVSDSLTEIKLKPVNSSSEITVKKFSMDTYTSDFEVVNAEYDKLTATYGLKYSSENIYGLPMFSILGYQIDKIDKNIKPDVEYILDIIDGKMLFIDDENNRKIYLNFNFDDNTARQSISVNIEYFSDEFTAVRYFNMPKSEYAESFTKFISGKSYASFNEEYLKDPENVIEYESNHSITVHNSGNFIVDVFGKDDFNNIFAARCQGDHIVTMPDLNMYTFTNNSTTGDPLNNISYTLTEDSVLNDNNQENSEDVEENILGGRLVVMTPEDVARAELESGFDYDGNGVVGNGYTDISQIPINSSSDEPAEDESFAKPDTDSLYKASSVGKLLYDQFIDFCIYRPSYLIPGIDVSVNNIHDLISVSYPSYSYSLPNVEQNDIIRFINLTDKYNVKVLDNVKSATTNKTKDTYTYEGYELILEPASINQYTKVIGRNNYNAITALNNHETPESLGNFKISSLLSKFYSAKYNYSNVNLVYFNELSGFPCVQTYADMANELAFYKNSKDTKNLVGDYKLNVEDDSWRGYIWAKVKDCVANNLVDALNYAITEQDILSSHEFKIDASTYNQLWVAYDSENTNSSRYKETVLIPNPSKTSEDDNLPDKIEVQRYINPTFDASAKYDIFYEVSKFIMDNFKHSSIYWLDSSIYWFDDYTYDDVIENLNNNSSRDVSSNKIDSSIKDEKTLIPGISDKFVDLSTYLNNISDVNYLKSDLINDMDSDVDSKDGILHGYDLLENKDPEILGRDCDEDGNIAYKNTEIWKYALYPYILNDSIQDIYKTNINLPYTDKGETITTNLFLNVAGLLTKYAYDDFIEDEIKKIFIDYSTPFRLTFKYEDGEEQNSIDTYSSIFDVFANELLNVKDLPEVTGGKSYSTYDINNKMYFSENPNVKVIDFENEDSSAYISCIAMGQSKYEEIYSLNGFSKGINFEIQINDVINEKYIGLTTAPFPAFVDDAPQACEHPTFGVHIIGKWVKNDQDTTEDDGTNKYKDYKNCAEIIINGVTSDENTVILKSSNDYVININVDDTPSSVEVDEDQFVSLYRVVITLTELSVNPDLPDVTYTFEDYHKLETPLYASIGFTHSEILSKFVFISNEEKSRNIGTILKSARSQILPDNIDNVEQLTIKNIIERFIADEFVLNKDVLKDCIQIACEKFSKRDIFTPYSYYSVEHDSLSDLQKFGSIFGSALVDLTRTLVKYKLSSLPDYKFNNRNVELWINDNSLYFPISIDTGDVVNPSQTDDTLFIIRNNFASIITLFFKNMQSVRSDKKEDVNENTSLYNAILYIVYAYILYRLMHNMYAIASSLNNKFNEFTLIDGAKSVLAKYLILTEGNILPVTYDIVKTVANGVNYYFLDYDCSVGFLKTGAQDLSDKNYEAMVLSDSYSINPENISYYDKVLTIKSKLHFDVLKYRNWVLKGEVLTKENGVDDALYAVVSNYKQNIEEDRDYINDFDEVDSSVVSIKDSVAIAELGKQDSSLYDFDEERDTISDLVHEGAKLFYVKLAGHAEDGYSSWTKSLPENATTSVKDLLGQKYISTYIKPSWKIAVTVTEIDTSKPEYSKLDKDTDYIYVSYKDSYFTPTFNIGEKVKLISESTISSLYYAQATYTVVGYDLLHNGIILRGKFNSEYINSDDDLVWHRITSAIKNGVRYMTIESSRTIGTLNYDISNLEEVFSQGYDITLKDENDYEFEFIANNVIKQQTGPGAGAVFLFDCHEVSILESEDENNSVNKLLLGNIEVEYIELYLVNPKEDGEYAVYEFTKNRIAKNSAYISMICNIPLYENERFIRFRNSKVNIPLKTINGELHHRAYTLAQIGNDITPVFLSAKFSEKLNIYVAYTHQSYADYQMNVVDGYESMTGTTSVSVEYNGMNVKTLDFIDDTFSVTIDKFNPYEGQAAWMDSTRLSTKWNDAEPEIIKDHIYGYRDTTVILSLDKNNVAFVIDLSEVDIDQETCYNYWKIYKRNLFTNESTFMFESYNPVLYLNYDEKGTYDIEAFVFDKYGNLTSKRYNAAFIIK